MFKVLSLGALKLILRLISAEGVLYLSSFIVIITSLILLILSAFIRLNIVITSFRSSSF
jgi:hypothetical protein